jgi:pyrroline-5-carboxylate reductase
VLNSSTYAIIGAGNMGRALLQGLLGTAGEGVSPDRVTVTRRRPEKGAEMARALGVRTAASNVAAIAGADVVLLAVKPQILTKVLAELHGHNPTALYVSVAAGVSTERIEVALGGEPRVVRAMPNTAAIVRQSATAVAPGAYATEADMDAARAIFDAVGRTVTVEEHHLDAVTGLSGSGPAYIFLILDALSDAGVKVGLSRDVAAELAAQTVMGSAQLLLTTGEHPGRLKDQGDLPRRHGHRRAAHARSGRAAHDAHQRRRGRHAARARAGPGLRPRGVYAAPLTPRRLRRPTDCQPRPAPDVTDSQRATLTFAREFSAHPALCPHS